MGSPSCRRGGVWPLRSVSALTIFSPMLAQMKLARIIISELTENQVIYLREVDGPREFPILIGIFEATNIDRRVKGDYAPPRPLTHDLVGMVAHSLGGEIVRVVISDLDEGTYYAKLVLQTAEDETIEVDARPSDAIAVAVTHDPALPIFVAEEVLAKAAAGE